MWVMELSARLFGFSTWSVMVPGVLEGVAAVALLYSAVRRVAGSGAGLAAGAVLAVTPVAALMFRFDNPDALLVLLLVASAYCVTRAVERAGTRWIVAAGALIGLAFLTKMLQAFTVVPAFGLVYLVAAPTTLRRRLLQLLAGLAALVAAGGWWVALVALTPAADRPFIDGSPGAARAAPTSAGRPASCACSTMQWAGRRPGSYPLPSLRSSPVWSPEGAGRGPIGSAPP
jgi:4-amino-4-deoxy-L-arabinose transferase-like glycosyltransferase